MEPDRPAWGRERAAPVRTGGQRSEGTDRHRDQSGPNAFGPLD
jgi:hypothetical protein